LVATISANNNQTTEPEFTESEKAKLAENTR
jgi:hypothetical protein